MNARVCWKAGWICGSLLLLMAGCATLSVNTEQHPRADFSAYEGYAWISADPLIMPPGEQSQVSPLTVRLIREAIEAGLEARGYRRVPEPGATVLVVAFTVGTRERIDALAYPPAYRGPWDWNGEVSRAGLSVYQVGSLSIDLFDGGSHQPIWHGIASKVVTSSDRADPAPVIDKAVTAMLKKLPLR